jgi:hypothetical protein
MTTTPATLERAGVLRTTGAIGIGSGLLFAAMTAWEQVADPSGGAGVVNQTGFAVAMAGYVVLAVGLAVARPGGRRSTVFPALLSVAWTALLAGALVESLASVDPDGDPLDAVGGLLQAVALIGLGITTAVAGRWRGWRRFWALGVATYYTGVLFVPAVLDVEPSAALETLWALGYAGLGLALAVEAGWGTRRAAAGAAALTAVVAGVVLVTGPATPADAQARTHDSSGAVLLELHRYASADSLEHYARLGS